MRLFPHVGHAPVKFFPAERWSDVFDQPAALIVLNPVLKVMQPRVEPPGAASVAVAVHLDEAEHFLRRVGRGMQGDQASHAECDLEERPAIHAVHVDRRRLDGVVQFERVVDVGCAAQGEGELVDPFPDRQFGPSRAIATVHQLLEFLLADECFLQRQPGGLAGAG